MSKRTIPNLQNAYRLMVGLAAAMLVACSGTYLPEDDEGREEWAEFGEFEQAITAVNGHGIAADGGRCLTPAWAGGYCWLPEEKGWVMSFYDLAPGHPEYPSEYTWWKTTIKTAMSVWRIDMQARGWGIASPGDNAPLSSLRIGCSEANASDANVRGRTIPTASWPNIVSMPAGELRKFTSVTVLIDCHDLEFVATFSTRPEYERFQYVYNIVRHELMHTVGLGHVVGFTCAGGMTLMNASATEDCWFTNTQNPTSQEWGWLNSFVGDND